jgi:enoyl-CoA hydratase
MPENLDVQRVGAVLHVEMHAAHANALSEGLVGELTEALRAAENDDGVACLALTSASRSFCSGADLGSIRAAKDDPLDPATYARFGRIYDLFAAMLSARVPTIAGIGGHVVGAGINLALACDVRIVATDVQVRGFSVAGVHPGGGHIAMMTDRLRLDRAAATVLFGQPMDGPAALESGFATALVDRAELRDRVLAVAEGAGDDVELARAVTASYRATVASGLTPQAAVLLERAPQVWSLHRRPS